jgi:uncharacterized repeat protein (TIGR01451 family)
MARTPARARATSSSHVPPHPLPRPRGMRRLAALVITALAAATLVAIQPVQTASAATTLLSEGFGGSSVADPAWKPLGSACLTRASTAPSSGSSTLGVCGSRTQAPAVGTNPGFLQLTDNRTGASGGVVYDTALPANGGLDIRFDQYQYGTGASGADGIGFFLADGSVSLTGVGAGGSSLGYSQSGTVPGVNGGYLGVGLDAYGGFSSTAGGGTGCASTPPGQRANAIALRGPGQGLTGYCYLTGATLPSGKSVRATAGSTSATTAPTADLGRSIRITVSSARFPVVTVFHGQTAGASDANMTQVLQYTMTTPAPQSFKLGYVASTGAVSDTHLIREVKVSSIENLSALNLVKQIDRSTAQPAAYVEGADIPYQFILTNTQGLLLTNPAVSDPLIPGVNCPSTLGSILGGSVICTGTHRVTAIEAVNGNLVNTATATANNTLVLSVTSNASSVTAPIATPAPSLSLRKVGTLTDANGNGKADVGERIAYSFIATNTGNVTLDPVAVTDPRVTGITPATARIGPNGGTQTFTSTAYTVTQADVDAGAPIVNVATVTGRTLAGQAAPTATSTVSTPVNGAGAITLTKDAVLTGGSGAGATVTYTLKATNSGNVPLTGVTIADPLAGLSAMTYTWPGTAGTLAAGASVTATATYSVKQSDVDAGQVANTATARGTTSGGVVAQSAASRTVTLARTASLDFTKTASPSNVVAAGSVVTYGFLVRNTGTTTLTGVGVSDPRAGVSALTYTWPQTAGTLAPGQVATATATYTATAADVQAGSIVNTATATATTSAGATLTRTATATVTAVPDPVADSATTPQGTPVVIDVLANDGRAATGATFSRAQLSATPKAVGGAAAPTPAAPESGSVTCVDSGTTRGSCTYSPLLGFIGVDVFDYSLSSGVGTWNVRVTVTVTAVNRTPVARPDRLVATTGGATVTIDPRANDTDPTGDALAITGAPQPAALRGTLTCSAALCTYVPPTDGWTGSVAVTYTITDRPAAPATGITATSTLTVFVDPAPLTSRGFTDRADTSLGVSVGTWTSTSTITAAAASCVAGRPVTAIAWTAAPGATDWIVERRLAGTTPGSWITAARLPGTATTYSDDRVGESRTYQWRVRPDLQRWVGIASAASPAVLQPAAVSAGGC